MAQFIISAELTLLNLFSKCHTKRSNNKLDRSKLRMLATPVNYTVNVKLKQSFGLETIKLAACYAYIWADQFVGHL